MDNIGQNQNTNIEQKDSHKKDDSNLLSNINTATNNKDIEFSYFYKKTEKLATALYMVTNLFADSEPMKWTLRSKVSNLVSFVISFKNVLHFRNNEFKSEIRLFILEIISLIEISAGSGLISPMNFRILKTEFINLIDSISKFEKIQNNAKSIELNNHFFDVKKDAILNEKYTTTNNTENYSFDDNTDNISTNSKNSISIIPKKTNRQNIIINLLKKKDNLSIKDIATVIKDCSEKTIQRELISLVNIGVLKKQGERRWSRYSLIKGF